ncbi:MAG: FHA domain-containing protein [Propionibacteriaceae bacterium]|jgi:hypothetical protein|nr:FHA domain-containing protein [Propionibacteriaceae bacterium]
MSATGPDGQPGAGHDYDALWAPTTLRPVERAAVRAVRDDAAESPNQSSQPNQPPAQPVWGTIVVSTGEVVAVSGDILFGRAPRAIPGRDCRLIRLPSPTQAISRNHAIVAPRDGGLVIEGLGALNGTRLRRGQHPPYLIGRGQVVALFPADVLDLGDDVTLTVGPPGGPA